MNRIFLLTIIIMISCSLVYSEENLLDLLDKMKNEYIEKFGEDSLIQKYDDAKRDWNDALSQQMDKVVNDRVAIQQTLGHATMTMTDRFCGYRPKEYIDKAHLKTTSEFIQKLKASK